MNTWALQKQQKLRRGGLVLGADGGCFTGRGIAPGRRKNYS
ncbi:hypothetical protein BH20VER1_BH20VER1_04590 [soil metagenome]